MRRLLILTLFLAVAWVTLGASSAEAQKLRVVTSTTDLKALTEAVTGDLAEVDPTISRCAPASWSRCAGPTP